MTTGQAFRLVTHELTIAAPVATVYDLLTDADGLLEWLAVEAEVDPTRGEYIALEPPHRLAFTYGWEDPARGIPPGSTTVEIELEAVNGSSTRLRLVHRGVPVTEAEGHEAGWVHFLGQLAQRAEP